MDSRLVVARRELATLYAEKTIVLALLVQLFVAAFSSFLVVGLVSLYDPAGADVEVDVAVTGEAREALLEVVREQPGLDGLAYGDEAAARSAFRNGEVDAVLLARRADGRIRVSATAPENSVETTVVVVRLREALRAFERVERVRRAEHLTEEPLALPPEATSSPYYGFTYTVLVPLLLFLPGFISGSLAVDSLSEEIDRGTLELLRVAPLGLQDIVDGKLLAAVGLVPAQAALWLGLLSVNGTRVESPLGLLAVATAFGLLVAALGAGLSLAAPDRRSGQFLYSVGTLGVFGAASLLPRGPPNTVARLAVGSADGATYLAVAGYALFAVAGYLVVRWLVARADVE